MDLHGKINPKDWQVLSLCDVGFLQSIWVVSGDYGKPCIRLLAFPLRTTCWRTRYLRSKKLHRPHGIGEWRDRQDLSSSKGLAILVFGALCPEGQMWNSHQLNHISHILIYIFSHFCLKHISHSSTSFHPFSYTGAYFVLAFLCRVLCQPTLGRLVVAQEAAKTGFGENREECQMRRGETAMTCLLYSE